MSHKHAMGATMRRALRGCRGLGLLLLLLPCLWGGAARAADGEPAPAGEAAPQVVKPTLRQDTGLSLPGATPDAEVFVDGERVARTPVPGVIPLAPGEHTIRVARLGFAPYIDVFRVKEGKVTRVVEAELVPVAGVLRVGCNKDKARVFVDGRFVGETPLEIEVKVGTRQVRVAAFGATEERFTVAAVAGQKVERDVTLKDLPPGQNPYKPVTGQGPRWYEKWWVWTVGAVGVAAIATAIIVPTVLSSRSACEQLQAETCVNVPAASTVKGLMLQLKF